MAKKDQRTPPSSEALAQIAQQLYQQTSPVRTSLINSSKDFLSGNFDPTQTPGYGAQKSAIEQQFTNARDSLIGSTPRGGALTGALSNFETQRALAESGLVSDVYNTERNQANQIGFGAPLSMSTSSLANAGNIQAQIAMSNSQQNAAAKQGLGEAAGTIGAAMVLK